MAILIKVIRHSDGGMQYLRNMCNYICDGREIAGGGYGLNPYDPGAAYLQMAAARSFYDQEDSNPLVHFVISFDGKTDSAEFAAKAAPQIAAYFRDWYQVLWCIHPADQGSSHYHMHLLLHSVNLLNGKLYHSGPYEVNGFCYHVKSITGMPYRLVYEKNQG